MRGGIDAAGETVQDPLHLKRERPRSHNPILRAPQLRGRDHLHRFRDLLRRFHRADAAPKVEQ
jgi:hypothetical protein